MKEIQEWLGHSDYSTTANIYGHLDVNAKLRSADAMRATGMNLALQTEIVAAEKTATIWYRWPDSNRHVQRTLDFESSTSTVPSHRRG